MLHALRFRVSFSPGEADDFSKKHFGKLVTQHEMLCEFAALGGELDSAPALNFDVAVASHAFDCGGDRGWSDVQFFGETRADGSLLLLEHFPNGFEVIFLRDAGFIAAQKRLLAGVFPA